jgi:hypothetical protein
MALDLIYARGVPDSPSLDPTSFNKTDCTPIHVEIGFCKDFGCDDKIAEKTSKYSPLIAALRKYSSNHQARQPTLYLLQQKQKIHRRNTRSIIGSKSISPAYACLRREGYPICQTQGQTPYYQWAPLLRGAYGCLHSAPRLLLGCCKIRISKRRAAAPCTYQRNNLGKKRV